MWVIQTTQAVQTMSVNDPSFSTEQVQVVKKLGILETIRFLIQKGGVGALWRGIGPALVLVLNPIIQVRA
jgi:adenine nucleotide transporter 17